MKNQIFPILVFTLFGLVLSGCENPMTDGISAEEMEVELRSPKKKHPVPFAATFSSKVLILPPQPNPARCGTGFPLLNVEQTLSGNATHLGKITGTVSSCVDVSTSPPTFPDVKFTLEAANGDLLYIEGVGGPTEIVGGTGRFEYATGSVTGSFEATGPGEFLNHLEGEIRY